MGSPQYRFKRIAARLKMNGVFSGHCISFIYGRYKASHITRCTGELRRIGKLNFKESEYGRTIHREDESSDVFQ
jgi:hypothetical protein